MTEYIFIGIGSVIMIASALLLIYGANFLTEAFYSGDILFSIVSASMIVSGVAGLFISSACFMASKEYE